MTYPPLVTLCAGPLKQHTMAYLAAHSRCCLCGRPAYSTGGFSLWCLKCLQPFIDAAADYVPVVTMRRAAARQDAVAVPA